MKSKTKIVATIGPASNNLITLRKMKKNGMDVGRINTKYTNKAQLFKIYDLIRRAGLEVLIDINNLKILDWMKDRDYEYVAISFASSARQIKEVKKILGSKDVMVIAKIENKKGIRNFDNILKESDGIMVARGDLSENIPIGRVPIRQKEILKKCKKKGKISITATEMLYSLKGHKTPKNSETNDVVNAVFDGSTMVMLSEETAVGKYPANAVKVMESIIKEAEKNLGRFC
ncbi:MAG: pyruvate kinase [Nanoarchaeota archaeon]|nr:pyruvate kinase [Nanoarchaeota archaeon]